MSRKIMRNGMRREAELRGYKPSVFVHKMWEELQIALLGKTALGKKDKKVGIKRRIINQEKGTHPKRTWRNRIVSSVE